MSPFLLSLITFITISIRDSKMALALLAFLLVFTLVTGIANQMLIEPDIFVPVGLISGLISLLIVFCLGVL